MFKDFLYLDLVPDFNNILGASSPLSPFVFRLELIFSSLPTKLKTHLLANITKVSCELSDGFLCH